MGRFLGAFHKLVSQQSTHKKDAHPDRIYELKGAHNEKASGPGRERSAGSGGVYVFWLVERSRHGTTQMALESMCGFGPEIMGERTPGSTCTSKISSIPE
jgi:hypothetical protein